jgi:GT2 family glycosyltransferase
MPTVPGRRTRTGAGRRCYHGDAARARAVRVTPTVGGTIRADPSSVSTAAPQDSPAVSVCTPTYQGCDRLRRVSECLFAALSPGDEWVISVDGSTDGTAVFVAELAAADERVVPVVAATNRGRTVALNAACSRASRDIVLRLDDDILVEPGLVAAHAAAHAESVAPIGVVHTLVDSRRDGARSTPWEQFTQRNAELDWRRQEAADSLPASAWGAVCSVRREVGDALGWYDERFDAYGWEDVELGYRLRRAGVRIVRGAGAPAVHLPHAVDFARKLARDLEAGRRMALFATIHGPQAVLAALGHDAADFRTPRRVRRRVLLPGLEGPAETGLTGLALAGERALSRTGWRRAYDGWVARWLTWAYARGWESEVRRCGLPAIPSPPTWPRGSSPSWPDCWAAIVDATTAADADSATRSALRAVARSALLRCLEADAKPAVRRWRETAGAVARATEASLARSGGARPDATVDVLAVVDAPTPSVLGTTMAAAKAAAGEGLRVHVVCATESVAAGAREAAAGLEVSTAAAWRPNTSASMALGSLLPKLAPSLRAARRYSRAATLPRVARIQLTAEAMLALARREACRPLLEGLQPAVVVSASEYFDLGAMMAEAAAEAGVPFVTLQHGAVNLVFAPFVARRYFVWSPAAADALGDLDPSTASRIALVQAPDASRGGPVATAQAESSAEPGASAWTPPAPHLVGVFSQTHGAEFTAATHFAVAAQLDHLLGALPDVAVAIKRHPSERVSVYESLLSGPHAERVGVAPEGMEAAAFAAACDVVCALSSTALRDAMAAGRPSVEVLCSDSLVVQPLAVERVPVAALARTLARLVEDETARDDLVDRQNGTLLAERSAGAPFGEALRAVCTRAPAELHAAKAHA